MIRITLAICMIMFSFTISHAEPSQQNIDLIHGANKEVAVISKANVDQAFMLAKLVHRKAVEMLGKKHPETVVSARNLVKLYNTKGQADKAAKLQKEYPEIK
ncbi:MAG: hypothetical protein ACRBBN_13830 [Methyloligellaceae bacterium]